MEDNAKPAENKSLKPLASAAVLPEGGIAPFEEQIAAYAYGQMPSGDMFVIAQRADELGVPTLGGEPLLMKQSTVRKVQAEHEIGLAELENLPWWLESHPLAMDSITDPDSIVVIADAQDAMGRNILIAIRVEVEKRGLVIDEITSLYGKKSLQFLIDNTGKSQGRFFVNDRTGDWILRTGLQLPERIASRLHPDLTTADGGAVDAEMTVEEARA